MRKNGSLFGLAALAALVNTGSWRAAQAQEAQPQRPALVIHLADVERSAGAQQPQILIARAATSGAQGLQEQARSPLLPQVLASSTYTRETANYVPRPGVFVSNNFVPPASSLTRSFDFWVFGIGATQLIYDFGQTWQKYRAARFNAEAQHDAERTTTLQVVFAVRRAYFNARAGKDLVGVALETLGAQKKHLQQVQGFVTVGTQPLVALAQQKAAVANAQVGFITAQNNYETAKAQLDQAAGLTIGTDYDLGDEDLPPVEEEDQPLDTLAAAAIAARPEIATLAKQREAQEATLHAARGGYGPALSANASANEQGTALDGLVANWAAGLAVNWPIFQGGLTRGQVRQAQAGIDSVDAQRSLEELQVRLDVDSARLAVRAAKATISAAQDAEASAREQLRLAEQRYATGVGSIIELNDAQVAFTSAAAQLVQARYGLASARAQLLAALGRT
jgi:outer membrane protein